MGLGRSHFEVPVVGKDPFWGTRNWKGTASGLDRIQLKLLEPLWGRKGSNFVIPVIGTDPLWGWIEPVLALIAVGWDPL